MCATAAPLAPRATSSLPLSVLCASLLLAWLAGLLGRDKTADNAPPVWRGGWPLIGHFAKFAVNPLAAIREGYERCGPVFTMNFLSFKLTFLVGTAAHTPFFQVGAGGRAAAGGRASRRASGRASGRDARARAALARVYCLQSVTLPLIPPPPPPPAAPPLRRATRSSRRTSPTAS